MAFHAIVIGKQALVSRDGDLLPPSPFDCYRHITDLLTWLLEAYAQIFE